ncbi:Hypothetical predicted protein [Cloeon dipterum]|uniref:C-type lectin domain-containing protein n=1 Tax=Cloeon dipterum TaxID=197152 RepID=A0A8S1DDL7_9INSE|nr:Hypothetical predicted protein [Cloeon dipterum]
MKIASIIKLLGLIFIFGINDNLATMKIRFKIVRQTKTRRNYVIRCCGISRCIPKYKSRETTNSTLFVKSTAFGKKVKITKTRDEQSKIVTENPGTLETTQNFIESELTTTAATTEPDPCAHSRCSKLQISTAAANKSEGKIKTKADTSFFLVSKIASQMEAAKNCLSWNMTLVALQDVLKLKSVQNIISDLAIQTIWTVGSNEGNGSCAADSLLSFAWCVKNEDIDSTVQEKIVKPVAVSEHAQKSLAFSANLSLTALASAAKLPYLCEPNADLYKDVCSLISCSKNASLIDSNGNVKESKKYGKWTVACSKNYLFSNRVGTWQQSLDFCCSLGLRPISFRSALEFQCFSNLTKSNWTLNWNYWTAGRAMGAWGRWAWCSGSQAVPLTDGINWATGQPDNSNPEDLCVHLQVDRNGTGVYLTDRNCSHKYVIACQSDVVQSNPSCTEPICPTSCLKNETFFVNSTIKDLYIHGSWNTACGKEYLFSSKITNWLDAWNYCCSLGMKLATISDFGEMNCLSKMVNKYPAAVYSKQMDREFWTSGSNLGCAGPHYWCSDGEKLKTDGLPYWKGGQLPAEAAGNCIFIYLANVTANATVLGADACTAQKQFLCEVLESGNKSEQIKRSCQETWEVTDQEIDGQILNSSALTAPTKINLKCYIKCCGKRGIAIKSGQLASEKIIRDLEDQIFDNLNLLQSSFEGYGKCSAIYYADECQLYSEAFFCSKQADPTLTLSVYNMYKGGGAVAASPTGEIKTKYRTCPSYAACIADPAIVNQVKTTGKTASGFVKQTSTGKKYFWGSDQKDIVCI